MGITEIFLKNCFANENKYAILTNTASSRRKLIYSGIVTVERIKPKNDLASFLGAALSGRLIKDIQNNEKNSTIIFKEDERTGNKGVDRRRNVLINKQKCRPEKNVEKKRKIWIASSTLLFSIVINRLSISKYVCVKMNSF